MEFEELLKQDLQRYLTVMNEIDAHLPEAPDLEEKWESIAKSYLPDGIREFAKYPTVSLGWMMYTGMAMAALWDGDWQQYDVMENIYEYLRDQRGYDCMDEYIREEVLQLDATAYDATEKLVAECASRTNSMLIHQPLQPGTKEAFDAYVSALHQLYTMGIAIQLKRMGYRMERVPVEG